MSNPRAAILSIYRAALAAVQGAECVRRLLVTRPLHGDVFAVAVGKAAGAMLEGASQALGAQLRGALLITKAGHVPPGWHQPGVTAFEAGHPLPDAQSLAAGEALLHFIAAAPRHETLLFLISGGASSLLEVPAPGVDLDVLQRVNRWLLGSGWDIRRMNALRKRLSAIKGGRLATRLQGRRTVQLLISDVPGDDPAAIGSGPLVADDAATIDEAALPEWLRALMRHIPPRPPAPLESFSDIETHIVAALQQALNAAGDEARRQGYQVRRDPHPLKGDAAETGRRLARALIDGAPSVYLWGGETTVNLPAHPGRGGRNQHLALAAAEVLAGHDKVWLLAAGTDGSDGSGGDAGALVDGGTIARGDVDELNAADSLRRADAGTFLGASGDLITTGPTGTNVMDLAIGLKLGD